MLDGEDLDGPTFVKIEQLLDNGAIDDLQRLESACSNLFKWCTH